MQTWEIWFSDGRVEQHCRREQLSVSEMESLIGGYMDMQLVLCDGELRDMAVRWDAKQEGLPINQRATDAWREALATRGLSALPPDEILGDVIVLGYPLLRREVRPAGRLETVRAAAEESVYIDFAALDRATMELVLGELLEIERDAQLTGYRAAVENAITQYRAILMEMSRSGDEPRDASSER